MTNLTQLIKHIVTMTPRRINTIDKAATTPETHKKKKLEMLVYLIFKHANVVYIRYKNKTNWDFIQVNKI